VLELKIEPVATGGWERGVKLDLVGRQLVALLGVDVEEGEVAFAQGDQMPLGAEVGRQILDRPAIAADGEGERARLAGDRVVNVQPDLVAGGLVDRPRRREGARLELAAGDEEVGGERLLLAVNGEVGEGASGCPCRAPCVPR